MTRRSRGLCLYQPASNSQVGNLGWKGLVWLANTFLQCMSKHSLRPFQRLTALPTALRDTHPCMCQSALEAGAAALFSVPWEGGGGGCVICNARCNTVFYCHARSHPRSSYTEKAKPSLKRKALLETISDLTQGIWVGFAAFYNRGETLYTFKVL